MVILTLTSNHLQAQQAQSTSTTRSQVKMERDEFIKSHRWDPVTDNWVLKPEFEPPAQMKERAAVRRERDEFLKNNRWDPVTDSWIPLVKPRVFSQLSREEVKRETREFLRTHEWDSTTEAWTLKSKTRRGR